MFINIFETSVEAIKPGTLSADTRYHELNEWDSLAVLTFTDAIEIEYGVLLKRKDFENAATIEVLHNILQQKRPALDT